MLVTDGLAPCGIVTLTTDFGTADPYVGAMKGVVLGLAPRARIVDLSHQVPAYDPVAAAYVLEQSFGAFPPGTVHVVVVDPGVGTERPALLVRTRRHFLVGPGNGCLDAAMRRDGRSRAWRIVRSDRAISATFHGRDVFAPLAGRLAGGQPVEGFVERFAYRPRRAPSARLHRRGAVTEWVTRVVWIDRFGNCVTGLTRSSPGPCPIGSAPRGTVGSHPVRCLARTYGDAPGGEPFFIWGSGDHLEISMREDSAASRLGVDIGCIVRLRG